jgi:hypothetical protein
MVSSRKENRMTLKELKQRILASTQGKPAKPARLFTTP